MTRPTATDLDSLMRLVRWYYPPGLAAYAPDYQGSEQATRLRSLLGGVARDVGDVTEYAATHPPVPDEVFALGATARELRAWPVFLERVRQEFPGCLIGNKTISFADPCYACEVGLPGVQIGCGRYDMVVCLLSLLAPVYAIYGYHDCPGQDFWTRFPPLPEEFQDHERRLAALVEAEFGFTRLSKEILLTPTPDLVPLSGNLLLGEAKLIDCLITTEHPEK